MVSEPQTIRELLNRGKAVLVEHGVPNAQRNAEWILSHLLRCNTLDLYTGLESPPTEDKEQAFWDNIERRARREPLQYILGTTEFMSLTFEIPRGVFIPRPDTELLVEATEERLGDSTPDQRSQVLDLCCGCGVIAVSLAFRLPNLLVVAVDSNELAVTAARRNASASGVSERVSCEAQDAADYLAQGRTRDDAGGPSGFSAILCNPPYIETPSLSALPPEVRLHEPLEALDGGTDGLDFYRQIIPLVPQRLLPGGLVAFEIGETQARAVAGLLEREHFEEISVKKDYAGHDRIVLGVAGTAR